MKTKTEFIETLKLELSALPKYEIYEAISYYDEIIEDALESGRNEEEVIASFLPIKSIAQKIINDYYYENTSLIEKVINYNSGRIQKGANEIDLDFIENLSITANLHNASIAIKYQNIDKIKLKFYCNYKDQFSYIVNHNTLSIKENHKFDWKQLIPFYTLALKLFKKYKFILRYEIILPINYQVNNLNIVQHNNSILLENLYLNNSNIFNKNGKTHLNDLTANNLKVTNKNGGIIYYNYNDHISDTIELYNKNGSIKSNSIKCYNLSIFNKNGATKIENITDYNSIIENKNGPIKIDSLNAYKAYLSNKNGKIKVENLATTIINGKNKNGSIKLSNIKGSKEDYTYTIFTKNGSTKINDEKVTRYSHSGNLEKEIKLETWNGNIKLNFINN